MNDVNQSRSDNADQSPRRGDRDVARRGDRAGNSGRRDNTSYGERRGKRYDGSSSQRSSEGGARRLDDARGESTRGRPPRAGDSRRQSSDRRDNGNRRFDDSRTGSGRPGQDARAAARADEPVLPEDIEASDLDMEIRRDLRSLDKSNAEIVAKHLVAAMHFVDEDPTRALEHGRAAKNRAGRIGVVRETLGVLAYRAAEWAEALGELRAARRISGGPGLLAMMADCERGLERPQRAIEIARGDESRMLEGEDLVELRIVEAGARVDMGQLDAALVTLQDAGVSADAQGESAARLDYAYAEVLLAAGRRTEAAEWFSHAVSADPEQTTDAESRLAELGD